MKMDAILGYLIILVMTSAVQAQLKTGFYSTPCPNAEAIVGSTVVSHFSQDLTIAPGLLRLHFHDCFVQIVKLNLMLVSSRMCVMVNGVLESDQRLWADSSTQSVVQNYAGNVRGLLGLRFDFEFPKAMIKLSSIEVKTGTDGEIREVCSKFN
ncbi:hypothetical protein JHK84_047134 [Glycine max]|nr:hypothetical protein JHK84_047134 [Glycine max]